MAATIIATNRLGYVSDDALKNSNVQIQWELGENFRGKRKNNKGGKKTKRRKGLSLVVCDNVTVDIEPVTPQPLPQALAGHGLGQQASTYPKSKVYSEHSEKAFMNNVTRHVILSHKWLHPQKTLRVAVLDTERYDSSRAVPGPKEVLVLEHDPDRYHKMLATRPSYVKTLMNADTYYLSWFTKEPLDVDILDFCYTWKNASVIVEERFASGMYQGGTIVRLTVASRTSTPGARLSTWKNEIIGDIVTWASKVDLGVVFFRVCDWGPEVSRWSIGDKDSIVYEYGNPGSPMYNFIFRLMELD